MEPDSYYPRCDRYVSSPAAWPVVENRCILRVGHNGDHELMHDFIEKLKTGANTEQRRIGGGVVLTREECDFLATQLDEI